jgi:hypothetical protein
MLRNGPGARSRLAALASAQIFLVAAGAAAPSLHLGSASHHHVFCSDHERFEDEASRTAATAAAPSTPSGHAALTSAGPRERTHVACAFSNLLLRPMLDAPSGRTPSTSPWQPLEPVLCQRAGHAPLAALLLAPKHSPPPNATASVG